MTRRLGGFPLFLSMTLRFTSVCAQNIKISGVDNCCLESSKLVLLNVHGIVHCRTQSMYVFFTAISKRSNFKASNLGNRQGSIGSCQVCNLVVICLFVIVIGWEQTP